MSLARQGIVVPRPIPQDGLPAQRLACVDGHSSPPYAPVRVVLRDAEQAVGAGGDVEVEYDDVAGVGGGSDAGAAERVVDGLGAGLGVGDDEAGVTEAAFAGEHYSIGTWVLTRASYVRA